MEILVLVPFFFIEGEGKPTGNNDIIDLEKLKNKKYTLQLFAKPPADNGYIPFCDRFIEED